MNPKIILFSLAAALLAASCSDANEPEARDVTVNGFKEQDPAGYAAYTAALRSWKATGHQVTYARLDNAPAVSVSERDFLRSVPDSIDFVAMRNSATLSQADRDDMALVRNDLGTRVLYYVTASDQAAPAADAVRSGVFDGVSVSDPEAAEVLAASLASADCVMIFEGTPSKLSADALDAFDYVLTDISHAADSYDIEFALRLAINYVPAEKLLLCVEPGGTITDPAGVSRNSLAGAAVAARSFAPQPGGIAINNVGNDYYDPDIIYKRTRGAIQLLNPAAK